ncbi:MAG: hypothetical protein AAF449_10660 [Myxococcota bacterium]
MKLRYFGLTIDARSFPQEQSNAFAFAGRYICNYLQREVRRLKLEAGPFNTISVVGSRGPQWPCELVPEDSLEVYVPFEPAEYALLSSLERHGYRIRMLQDGFRRAQNAFPVHCEVLLHQLDIFRKNDYRNEWVQKKKKLPEVGMSAWLHCSLTPDAFELRLELRRGRKVVLNVLALTCLPDELIFRVYTGDVRVKGEQIVIIDDFGKTVFALDIEDVVD